jgi:hypothetical protein
MEVYKNKNIRLIAGQRQIRLLKLLPGQSEDKIKCQLHTAWLAHKPCYECISYSWGTLPPEITIECNRVDFKVRPSLYSALCSLRYESEPRILWTDAICINQSDNAEKSDQVSLMTSIYEEAKSVIAWIGEETTDSRLAIETIHKLCNAEPKPGIGVFNTRQMKELGIPPTFSFAYPALLTMLEEPYFSRSWVVQEIGVSKDAVVYWGKHSVKWKDLVHGLEVAKKLKLPFTYHPSLTAVDAIENARNRFSKQDNKAFFELLRQHRGCMATDPRDKVFAFWGLLNQSDPLKSRISPDYNIQTTEVYIKTATEILTEYQTLDLLSASVEPLGRNFEGLPSWVPDWSYTDDVPSLVSDATSNNDIRNTYRSAGDAVGSAHVLNDQAEVKLQVSGYCFDMLEKVGGSFEPYPLPQNWKQISAFVKSYFARQRLITEWEKIAGIDSKIEYVHTKESIIDAYWQTLATGTFKRTEDVASMRKGFQQWRKASRLPSWLDKPYLGFLRVLHTIYLLLLTVVVLRKPAFNFRDHIRNVTWRRLIRTKSGYIGLATCLAQEGDQIAILKGSKVPLVIRGAKDNSWELKGDAYVHGIMGGEAFDEEKCAPMLFT